MVKIAVCKYIAKELYSTVVVQQSMWQVYMHTGMIFKKYLEACSQNGPPRHGPCLQWKGPLLFAAVHTTIPNSLLMKYLKVKFRPTKLSDLAEPI